MPSRGGSRLRVLASHLGVPETQSEVIPRAVVGEDSSPAAAALDLEGAKFGAINALRTGNPMRDMMTAMLVPMVFKAVFDGAGLIRPAIDSIMDMFKKPPEMSYTREIKVEQMRNNWGYSFGDDSSRNSVLARAMTLFLAQKEIKYKTADVNLISIKENRYCYDSDSGGDDEEDKDCRSEAGQLKKNYRLARVAPEEQWIQVEPGIMFMKKTQDGEDGDKDSKTHKKTTTMSFMGKTEEAVDAFIDKAYNWYLDELRSMQDHSRYMYEMLAAPVKKSDGEGGGDDGEVRKYRRYKLSDEKTFQSLFFPEKETLLKLIADFTTRSGKYSIPGYPHKLGLLCHGPPGTGKTSLIKAMAHHTGRNIVNVPLARIGTNSELMDVMFDNRYHVVGQEVPIKLRFKDVIFVMEDVDAISKIVHRRDGKEGDDDKKTTTVEVSTTDGNKTTTVKATRKGSDAGSDAEKEKDEDKKDDKDKKDEKEDGKDKKKKADKKGSDSEDDGDKKKKKDKKKGKKDKKDESSDSDSDSDKKKKDKEKEKDSKPSGVADEEASGTSAAAGLLNALFGGPTTAKEAGGSGSITSSGSDRLNLSGILNALDGVVDSPNRILIMTTNHPEKLDPALIRPGRIDKKFLLTYMCGTQSGLMVQHYFQTTLTTEQIERIKHLVDGAGVRPSLDITPARLEQICAEHDTIDDLCRALGELAGIAKRPKLFKANSISVEGVLNMPSLVRAQSEMPPSSSGSSTKRW